MANRFPLVFDASTNKRIEELPSGDNLSLSGSSLIDAINITATGTITADTINVTNLNANGGGIAAVAISNSYNDLDNLPTLFSGDYNDLTNKPVLTPDWNDITNKPVIATNLSQLVNDTNFVTNAQIAITTSQVTDLANIATSGSFNDLEDVPNFVTNEQLVGGTLTVEISNTGDLQGSVFADDSSLMVDHLNNELLALKLRTDIIECDDFSLVATDNISIQTPQFLLLQTQSFEINNNNDGTFISDQDQIRFQGIVDFGLATVTGLSLQSLQGDLKGSVFADDSSLMLDGINNKVIADSAELNSLDVNSISRTGQLVITATNGMQLLPDGIFNVPNATTISLAATLGATLQATDDLVLTSTSGKVDFTNNTTVDFTNANVVGLSLEVALEGDFKGSVFGDDSSTIIDGITNSIHGDAIDIDNGTYSVKIDSTGAFLQWSSQDGISVTSTGGTVVGGTGGVTLVGATGAGIVIGDGTAGNIILGSGSNTVQVKNSTSLDISNLTDINFTSSTITGLAGSSISYTPGDSDDWDGSVPTTVGEALDRIASWIQTNGGGGAL